MTSFREFLGKIAEISEVPKISKAPLNLFGQSANYLGYV